jgi:hypothetical protein
MTTIYQRIGDLPQYVQDVIWSYNIEGHRDLMQQLFKEFNGNQEAHCMRCHNRFHIKNLIDKNQMDSFSAEYFFKYYGLSYHYGLICCDNNCEGRVNSDRFDAIVSDRRRYYIRRAKRLGIKFDKYDVDDDDNYY